MDAYVLCVFRRIKSAQDEAEPFDILSWKLARVVLFIEAFQAAVPEAGYHPFMLNVN
jgi:hypothetical protein